MSAEPDDYRAALEHALAHSLDWLASVATRPVGARLTADELAAIADPGLMAIPTV